MASKSSNLDLHSTWDYRSRAAGLIHLSVKAGPSQRPQTPLTIPSLSVEQLITLRGSILEDATPTATKHGTGRGLPLKDALEYVIPELNIHCLRLALNTPKVTEQLLKLDEQGVSHNKQQIHSQARLSNRREPSARCKGTKSSVIETARELD